jgi:hypothetical protein
MECGESCGDTSRLAEMLSAALVRGIPSADWYLIDGASGATADRRSIARRRTDGILFFVAERRFDLRPAF